MEFAIILAVVLFVLYSYSKPKKKINPIEAQELISSGVFNDNRNDILDFLDPYIKQLTIKESQLIYKDDYGDLIFDDWFRERDNFVKNKMHLLLFNMHERAKKEFDRSVPLHNYKESVRYDIHKYLEEDIVEKISSLIDELVDKQNQKLIDEEFSYEYNLSDPILFEKSVAKNFEAHGWEAYETKKSGDQGADVIAELDGYKLVVQCKLYSQPVGNKAVQEVFSANQYYKGDLALVVTNAGFTKSAKQLADSTDVILLHYSDLSKFLEELFSN